MSENKVSEVKKILIKAKWLLGIGIFAIILMPVMLTMPSYYELLDFSETGQIGDTIGGITAPFLNLIGAFLVFFALQAQVKANELIQEQIDKDKLVKELDNETENLNQLFLYLNESINNFRFKSLPVADLKNTDKLDLTIEYSGGTAFYQLFNQVRCHYHGDPTKLFRTQAVSELMSILNIMNTTINKINNTQSSNKEILMVLLSHLFNYKVMTRIRHEMVENLEIKFCTICSCNHGLPEELRLLILEIRGKLGMN